jgi:hypothetical protein
MGISSVKNSLTTRRVVILGRGAAGKSTAAVALGERTGLPRIELDGLFLAFRGWHLPDA